MGTLTEHWDGSSWQIVPSLDTRFNDEILNAVATVSPRNAWAVGEVGQSGYNNRTPLILHWDGASWQRVAAPSGVTGRLRAVKADSATDVWAAGDDGHGHPLVLHFDGFGWTQSNVPQFGASSRLRGLKVFSPSNVWAVGDSSGDAGAGSATLVLHWNGATWSRVPSPNPDPYSNVLNAIGGGSASDLWAVGQQARSKFNTGVPPGTRTLAMHWDGQRWSAVATPNTGDQDSLRGVVQNGPGVFTAVGEYQDTTTGVLRTLAQGWNGSGWATRATPNAGSADNLLRAATPVPGTADVWAVGLRLTGSGPGQTLILRGN